MAPIQYRKIPFYVYPVSLFGALCGGIVMIKDFLSGLKFTGDERIAGRTVIVTGANSGIGKMTAQELAARGGKVLMACRNIEACEKARAEIIEHTCNKNVHCRHLDLASLKSIRRFAEQVKKEEKRLDILVNNAGVMQCPESRTEDGFETQLGVNYLGPFLLTNLLLDKLTTCSPSRIVFTVNYIGQSRGKINFEDLNRSVKYDGAEAYYQSKLAQFFLIKELTKRLQGTGVVVHAAHPGIVRTDLGRHLAMEQSWISSFLLGPIWWLIFRKPIEGAQTPLYCAVAEELANQSGRCYSDCHEITKFDSVNLDDETSKRLWLISERWTREQDRSTSESSESNNTASQSAKS